MMHYESEIQEYIAADRTLRVLVVDDSAQVRRAVRETLELAGIEVEEAECGKAALESVYRSLPDLVLLDVVMPGMGGLSVLRTLRNSYTRLQLPIVLMTPVDSPGENVLALDLGANDYLGKPLDFDVMWARISNQLMQKQAAEYMRTARARLEQKVRQRTAELRSANARLKKEIEQRAKIESRLQKQANYDQLTSLPNRQLAYDRLRQVLNKASRQKLRPCVAFVDLDNFKHVNDTLGHAAGDELLREASRRLLACARKSDTVARLGGDEFLLILDDEGNERLNQRELAIRHVGDRIIESFAKPFRLEGQDVSVTPSIGFAIYPQDGEDGNTLMRHADVSMYRSKKAGKNVYCFYSEEMTAKARLRMKMESHLCHALERDELQLCYQPIVDIKTGKICKAEALLRWHNDELGELMPQKFIPVAEDMGIMVSIGHWVIEQACRQVRRWRDAGWINIAVTVNVSARQIQSDSKLADVVKTTLLQHGLSADALQIELTEQALLNANDSTLKTIDEFNQAGIRLLIDDFGSGYASLATLQKYRFDSVKIDRSHTRNMLDNELDSALIRAVVAMADSMGMSVISEGVEQKSQLNALLREKCRYAQGYYYSQPVADEHFFHLLHKAGHRPVKHNGLELVSAKA